MSRREKSLDPVAPTGYYSTMTTMTTMSRPSTTCPAKEPEMTTTTYTQQATYTKLRDGSWGIRVSGAPPAAGDPVDVHTAAGAVRRETVGRILWSGQGQGRDAGRQVTLCAIQQAARSYSSSSSSCCAECGRRGRLVERPDSSGIVAGVCSTCARLSAAERSYA
jgi:hypothetical protein